MVGLVALDLVGGAVFFCIRVGNRVAIVAVGINLENGRERLLVGAAHGVCGLGADFVEILAIGDIPHDAVTISTLGEAISHRRGAIEGGAHRVFIILNNVNDGELPKGGEIQRFVVSALVHGAVAHEAERAAFEAMVFEAVGESETERGLAADDAVAAPVIFIRRKKVHRAALAA